MPVVPSLFDLSSEIVTECIHDGTFNTVNYQFSRQMSNTIFEKLRPFEEEPNEKLIEEIARKFHMNKLNLIGVEMKTWTIALIKSQILESLTLGRYSKLDGFIHDGPFRLKGPKPPLPVKDDSVLRAPDCKKVVRRMVDIDSLLGIMLNRQTRQRLLHLDLSVEMYGNLCRGESEQFLDGWTKSVGKMLPSLRSLEIRQRTLTKNDFASLCSNFSNLKKLDISDTSIGSLNGIGQLKNLEFLGIGTNEFKRTRDIHELFDLYKLRYLSFESVRYCKCFPQNTHERYMQSRKVLPNLEYVDFTGTFIRYDYLKKFVVKHPTLKAVSVCDTFIRSHQISGNELFREIKVFSNRTLREAVLSLKHYTSLNNVRMVGKLLLSISELAQNERKVHRDSLIRECFQTVNSTMESMKFNEHVLDFGLWCYDALTTVDRLNLFSNEDKNAMMGILLHCATRAEKKYTSTFFQEVWYLIHNESLLETPGLNFNKICSLSFKAVVNLEIEKIFLHLEIIAKIIPKISPTSDVYQSIDKRALILKLENVGYSQELDENTKNMALHILAFVEINFNI